jgi:hypothetical protein
LNFPILSYPLFSYSFLFGGSENRDITVLIIGVMECKLLEFFPVTFSEQQWTFKQYRDDVKDFAKGLIALGLSRFGVVCIIGRNSPQWAIAAMGVIHAGYVLTNSLAGNVLEVVIFFIIASILQRYIFLLS